MDRFVLDQPHNLHEALTFGRILPALREVRHHPHRALDPQRDGMLQSGVRQFLGETRRMVEKCGREYLPMRRTPVLPRRDLLADHPEISVIPDPSTHQPHNGRRISDRLKVFWYNICPYPTLCRPSPLIGPP